MKIRPVRVLTLRTALYLFAAACVLPVAAVAVGLVFYLLHAGHQRTQQELSDRRDLMASAVEARIQNVVEDLQVLARSAAVRTHDFASFREHMVETGELIGTFGVVLVNREGQLLISSRRSPGESLPRRSSLDTQERVFASGKPQVSDLVPSTAGNAPIISVEVPVRIDGRVEFVLAAGLSPTYLADVVKSQVPSGWLGSIADSKGTLIARLPDLQLLGQPAIEPLRAMIGQQSGNWIEITSRSGETVFTSFRRIESLGWTVFLSIPSDTANKDFRRSAAVLGFLALIALAATLLLAKYVSRRIVTALDGLEHNVAALTHGRILKTLPDTLVEVGRMQKVLANAKSELDSTEHRIEREKTLLKSTVQSLPVGVLLIDSDENILLINRKALDLWRFKQVERFEEFTQVTRLRLDGTPYPPHDWPIMRALRTGVRTEDEIVSHMLPGETKRRLSVNAAPIYDAEGRIIAAVAAFYDVTALHEALEQQQLLLDEINHRVKNTLANIQSIALLTRSGSVTVEQYVESFQERLLALSRAYNLLTDNNWRGAEIRQIVATTTAPYGRSAQIEMAGGEIHLSAKHALALTATVQELCTNAAKYGSLSVPEGRLHIHWRLVEGHVEFEWVESHGPRVQEPTRRGFGSKLIQDILTQDPEWTVRIRYEPGGLVARIDLHILVDSVMQLPA